jgi:hypothetical protein
VRGTGHPPDHGKKYQKMNVDKIKLVFLYLHCKKRGYKSQGVVKKKISKNDLLGLGPLLGIPLHNSA